MASPVLALVRRDLRQARRRGGEVLTGLVFFLLALSLFPLGVGASPDVLARIGGGVIWVLALLAVLLGLERLWQNDLDDGSLEQLVLAASPLPLLVLARCAAHWLVTALPLVVASPLIAVLMGLPVEGLWALPLALLLGTPALTLIGAVGAALLAGGRGGAVLLGLLVLPLDIPVLIFGVGAVDGVLLGLGAKAPFLVLAALSLAALALAPFACAAALRLALA